MKTSLILPTIILGAASLLLSTGALATASYTQSTRHVDPVTGLVTSTEGLLVGVGNASVGLVGGVVRGTGHVIGGVEKGTMHVVKGVAHTTTGVVSGHHYHHHHHHTGS